MGNGLLFHPPPPPIKSFFLKFSLAHPQIPPTPCLTACVASVSVGFPAGLTVKRQKRPGMGGNTDGNACYAGYLPYKKKNEQPLIVKSISKLSVTKKEVKTMYYT